MTLAAPTTVSYSANAFKLTVDPGFKLDAAEDAIQDFGDTKHHTVDYTAVGTSRYNGYFRETTSVTFSGETPVTLSSTFGLDAASVRLTIPAASSSDLLTEASPLRTSYVDATAGTVALTTAGASAVGSSAVDVSWIPGDTLAGAASPVPVLSTARPLAPVIARIVPAWQLVGPKGSLSGDGILLSTARELHQGLLRASVVLDRRGRAGRRRDTDRFPAPHR